MTVLVFIKFEVIKSCYRVGFDALLGCYLISKPNVCCTKGLNNDLKTYMLIDLSFFLG